MKIYIILATMAIFLVFAVPFAFSAPKDGLMLYFTFDGDTKDLSGGGHDGELQSGAKIDKDVKKNGTGALRIDGGNQTMEVKTFKELEAYQDNTLLFWINFTAPASGGWDQIIAKPAPGGDRSPGLWVTPEGLSIHWRYNPGNLGPWGITKTGNQNADFFDQNKWFHIAGATNTKKASITAYVDGKEVASAPIPAKFDQGAFSFFIGKSPAYGGPAAKFVIDDVAFYDRVLSVDEINGVMKGVLNPVEPQNKLTSTWGDMKK
ncbi:TPA: LamG domain-containing protein [bacterium]|nr:LamG domain-containing protein [bacterium]